MQNEKTQSYINSAGCVAQNLAAGAGFEPVQGQSSPSDNSTTQVGQNSIISGQFNELEREGRGLSGHKSDTSGQQLDTSQHKKCAICVQRQDEMPDDLARVVAAWTTLTPDARSRIMEITDK